MTDNTKMREAFEKKFPPPTGAKFNGRWYVSEFPASGVALYNAQWEAWQAAQMECKHSESVAVMGEPVAYRVEKLDQDPVYKYCFQEADWFLPDEIGECQEPLYLKPASSITEAELATLREKAARIEQVEKERDEANARLHDVSVACATAEQERDELRKDAERYRWLRGKGAASSSSFRDDCERLGPQLDRAIDAAMQEKK